MNQKYEHLMLMNQTINKMEYVFHSFLRSNFQNIVVQDCIMKDCEFSRSSITNIHITNCRFINCRFCNMDLFFCKLTNCTFIDCDLSLATIENNNFSKNIFSHCLFTGSRLAGNYFDGSNFEKIDLNGSTTKLNFFSHTSWLESVFGNCTIDYNISICCKFKNTKMNIETLGSVWGIQQHELDNVSFLSLGRIIDESNETVYHDYNQYVIKKGLCLEWFTLHVSFKKENIFENTEELLNKITERYDKKQYLTPDELQYFYEILKNLRKNSLLPFFVLKEIFFFTKKLVIKFASDEYDDNYYETILLFYNNIFLIYNSMVHEILSFRQISKDELNICQVKIVFLEKPHQEITSVFNELFQYIYDTKEKADIKIVKEEYGSYIVWIILPLAVLAAFNIGTLLLTGGVKNLIKLRASTEVLFSKKLPRKYYLDVYKKDDSEELAKSIIAFLLNCNISTLPSNLRNLGSDGVNAQNIEDITVDKSQSMYEDK